MIPNTKLLNAIRSLGYRYKDQSMRVCIYKLQGGTRRIEIRKHEMHSIDYCRSILNRAGMAVDDIEQFIAESTETQH